MILKWLEKIFDINDARIKYARICFKRLKFLADNNNKIDQRFNWASHVKTIFFYSIGAEDVWKALSADLLREKRNQLLKKFETFLVNKDLIRL